MNSLFAKKPVLFVDELEHTKTFLYLELMQYGDCLEIVYDIKIKSFLIPALSLQPIVENAVKYGMRKKEHLIIHLSTYVNGNYYVIEVVDDGVGFDINQKIDDGKNHVGISNVKKRLEAQCNGQLIINSTIGKGTTVKIIIPKDREYENNCC
jgi:two-component system LytT family sensor kinase